MHFLRWQSNLDQLVWKWPSKSEYSVVRMKIALWAEESVRLIGVSVLWYVRLMRFYRKIISYVMKIKGLTCSLLAARHISTAREVGIRIISLPLVVQCILTILLTLLVPCAVNCQHLIDHSCRTHFLQFSLVIVGPSVADPFRWSFVIMDLYC